jgi:hypothetical protein
MLDEDESYPGEFERAAERARRRRQLALQTGWRPSIRGKPTGEQLLRILDEQLDPVEARAMGRMRAADEMGRRGITGRISGAEALRQLGLGGTLTGAEALALLGLGGVGHEPGRRP